MAEQLQLFTFSVRERISALVGELLFLCDKVKVGEEVRDVLSDKVIAAGGDIFREFERSVVNCESRRRRSVQETRRLYRGLAFILRPGVQLSRTELQQLSACEEELPPEQQKWSPNLGQEEPEPPHIKEEEEEFPVKREHDVECAQWSQLHQNQTEMKREAEPVASTSTEQMETEADGEDWGVSEAASSSDPAAALEPVGAEQLLSSHSSETETEDSDEDWKETRQPQSAEKTQLAPTKEFSCPECLSSFTSQISDHHIKSGNSFLSVQQLGIETIRAESLLPSAECHLIGTSGTTRKQKDSQQIHTCKHCGKSFIPQKLYNCEQCGENFTAPSHLKIHQRSHTGEKRYPCEQCGKRFSHLGYLKQHQLAHTREKSYHCEQCERRFSRLRALKQHQRTHTGEKPYPCEQCGKRFSHLGTLKVHQRTHTGEKPYSCKQCGKSFIDRGNLKKHQRFHTGEKPYPCDRCGRTFSQIGHRKQHQLTHTGEKPYPCEQCGKRFGQLGHLKRHQLTHTHHPDTPYAAVSM